MDAEQLELFGEKELNSIAENCADDLFRKVEELEKDIEIYRKALRICLSNAETLLTVFPRGTENYRATEEMVEYIQEVLEEDE
jgi:hypothetical protein